MLENVRQSKGRLDEGKGKPKDGDIRAVLNKLRTQQQEDKQAEKKVWGGALLNDSDSVDTTSTKSPAVKAKAKPQVPTTAPKDQEDDSTDDSAPRKTRSCEARVMAAFFSVPVLVAFLCASCLLSHLERSAWCA